MDKPTNPRISAIELIRNKNELSNSNKLYLKSARHINNTT